MKKKSTTLFLVLIAIITQSCSVDTPENYFDRTTLNVNKYSSLGAKDFQHMTESHGQNALYTNINGEFVLSDNYEAHIKTYKIVTLEKDHFHPKVFEI